MPIFGPITRALCEDMHNSGYMSDEKYTRLIKRMNRVDFAICAFIAGTGTLLVVIGLL